MRMKWVTKLAVAGCAVLLLNQCATKNEVRDLGYQIRTVNQKIDDVRNSTVEQMQKRQASSVSRLDQLQEQVNQIQAKIDEKGHQEILLREQAKESEIASQALLENMRSDYDSRLQMMEAKILQLEQNLVKMNDARVQEAQERARVAAQRAEEARKRIVVAAEASGDIVRLTPDGRKVRLDGSKKIEAASSVPSPSYTAVEQPSLTVSQGSGLGADLYKQALDQYKDKKYGEAYKNFELALGQNPKGDEAAEILFFMGESLYAQGEYDLAILDYQKVISNHAEHRRTPTALLKQGMSFEKLTDLETAKIIYKKLIAEYPDSSEAESAQQQLSMLQ